MINHSISVINKIEILEKNWNTIIDTTIRNSALELSLPRSVNEDTISSFNKKP